jgi:putative tryptophan/tyrosine transport system substrate-binding protein
MRRRNFIAGLTSTTVVWPLAARAQPSDQRWRIGVLVGYAEDDPEIQARLAGFRHGLESLGLSEGRNIHIDIRFAPAGAQGQMLAKELIASGPDVLVAQGTKSTALLQQQAGAIPIVFVGVSEPIELGFVGSLARPGGNLTGFMLHEAAIAGKWLQILNEIAPTTARAGFIFDPRAGFWPHHMPEIEATASSLGIKLMPSPVEHPADIQRVIEGIASEPNSGLVISSTATASIHRNLIIALAALHRLPAVYPHRVFAADGGLLSYAADDIELFQQAASYIDRILKGAKPSDLPVQVPTKFQFVLNLKTAKALGLTVPPALFATADEVIE